MITPQEIEEKAREFEIHTSNVQRDYVFGWLLFGVFTTSSLKDSIFLKGGNALRKGYFAETRYSSDLDFGIPYDIPQDSLLAEINKICDIIQEKVGVVFVKESNKVEEKFTATDAPLPDLKVYEARVYFKDFYGGADHIKLRISMDITRFDRVTLPLQMRALIHPYSDSTEVACEIRCMKLEEIIAAKLKCLMQRQHAPDLFDYAYTIKRLGGELDKKEVVRTLIRKTIFSRNPAVLKRILLKTAFDYFREAWDKSLVCAKQFMMKVEEAITALYGDLEVLFEGYADNGYTHFAFFDADLRAPIMHAARTQTLLRIRYKGEERLIEPYSLKYQQRRDGVEREYFFAYKLSGGSSEPGMKMFVAEHMQAIETTEPRLFHDIRSSSQKPEKCPRIDICSTRISRCGRRAMPQGWAEGQGFRRNPRALSTFFDAACAGNSLRNEPTMRAYGHIRARTDILAMDHLGSILRPGIKLPANIACSYSRCSRIRNKNPYP